jgi:hypothetical protein
MARNQNINTTNLGRLSRNPVVRSHATGKYFMLPWSQIIELAVKNGLDEK